MYKPEREKEILEFWNKNKIFEKSLEQTEKGEPFVFYDGPPFATGLPHFGHILPTTLKDIIPRYMTMKGRFVPRTWGWDCHGLPIENLVEKKLGLKNKKDIEDLGVDRFNKEARESVFHYADEWKKIIPRLGRWADMDHDYRTMNPSYTESVWWSFKTLYEKGLAYDGYKVMPFCPRCGTTLSNFELNQPGGYKDITDISAYVKFELVDEPGTYFLAWTTTPWTLPGNVALAVGSDIEYINVDNLIVAKELYEKLKDKFSNKEIIKTYKGSDLIGKSYKPVFDFYEKINLPNKENVWKVYGADFVTTTDGTGIVHIAPAFGEDDLNLGKKENLPFIQHVGTDGKFKQETEGFAGMIAKPKGEPGEKDAHQKGDIEMIKYLAEKGTLFAKEKIIHPYPHCWRCETPLLNYSTSSWFIKVTDLRDRLVEENKKVKWVPETIGDGRFGKWLENARDWGISRSRYWGAPLPIWQNEDKSETEVIGSIDELRKKLKRNTYLALRHGEGEHNVKDILISSVDAECHLTKKGIQQVEESARKLKDIDVIYVSPLLRTRETAEIAKQISEFTGEVIIDDRLREFDMGDFEGRPRSEYIEYENKIGGNTLDFVIPNGESYRQINSRVSDFIYDIDKKYEGKNILIVTHAGIIKALEAIVLGGREEDMNAVWSEEVTCTGMICDINFSPLPKNELNEIDLHRPYIDAITWQSPSGELMKRIPEVFDTWYDSGSMPFASKHYPFENKKEIENGLYFPADFISEGTDQTRGWFYSLIVLGVGLFNKTPYNHVVVNGLILAEDGRKMSKSLKNYPDLMETVDKYGADALRYFFASSPAVKAEDTAFSEKSLDEVVKKHFNRLFNVLSLYEMSSERIDVPELVSPNILDRWIVARLRQVLKTVTENLDEYQFDRAIRPIGDFIDDLSVWYVRRSRDRYKDETEEGKEDRINALSTTRFVLFQLSKIMAPFTPFLAEDLYQSVSKGILGVKQSVHLKKWPELKDLGDGKNDEEIISKMAEVRRIVTLTLESRTKAGIKVRQPLGRVMLRSDDKDIAADEEYLDLIKDEVNVKEIILDSAIENEVQLDTNLSPELVREGVARELIRFVQDLRKKSGLSPKDVITLTIETDEKGKEIIESFKKDITSTARIEKFVFENVAEGETLSLDHLSFRIKITLISSVS